MVARLDGWPEVERHLPMTGEQRLPVHNLLMGSSSRPTPFSIIGTRLVPPRRSSTDLARPHLVARLLDARRLRCIVLCGGAGSGKTSLLTAWQQALAPLGFEVAWLTLAPDSDEPASFVDGLLASLGMLDPVIVREARVLSGVASQRDAIERVIIALVQGLAEYGREVVLVIDELHHVRDPLILDGALQFLLDYAPPNFHLALATRRAVPLALGRLHAEGRLLELNAQDLRFSPEESSAFLTAQLGSVSARDAAHLHSLSDGWPAGLQLLSLGLRHTEPGAVARRTPIQDVGSFSDYFEREVLARLDPRDIDYMTRVAACGRFSARLLAELIARDEAQAAVAAANLIARLERENLFIIPEDGAEHERWYRLHPLLREVLLARLRARLPEDQQALHAQAADWFEREGLLEEAVRHRLDAGQGSAAASLIEQCADELQLGGDLRGLASILRRLPPRAVAQHLHLRFLQAQWLMRTRQFDAHERALQALERDTPAHDELHRFMLITSRAAQYVQRDDTAAIHALLPQLENLPRQADGWLIGAQKNLLSLVLMHQDDHEGARQAQAQGRPRLVRGEPLQRSLNGLLMGRCFIGLSHELEGNVLQAERQYRDVLRDCDPTRDRDEPALIATALLGEVLYERGEAEAALRLLEPQAELLERATIPDAVLRVLLVLARAHRLAGRRMECMAYLERLEDHALSLGLDRLLAAALLEQMRERLHAFDFASADALLERLETLERRHAGRGGTLGDVQLAANLARAVRAHAGGQLEAAAAGLRQSMARCEARGLGRRVARLQMLAAVVEQQCARVPAARALAMQALARGHRLGLVRSLLDAHGQAPGLIAEVRDTMSPDPILCFYVDRLLAVPAVPERGAAIRAPRGPALAESLSQRETEILRMLALALPNKKIARSLGVSLDTVKWHLRNIYRKMEVGGRDDAVARARDLGLASN